MIFPLLPACNASSVIVQNSTGKKFQTPAVQISSETEMELIRLADAGEQAKIYFRSASEEFTSMHLNDLLYKRNSFIENKMAETSATQSLTKLLKSPARTYPFSDELVQLG